MNHHVGGCNVFAHGAANHRVPILLRTNNSVNLTSVKLDVRPSLLGGPRDLRKHLAPEIVHRRHGRSLSE
jgi:hypothetical protein